MVKYLIFFVAMLQSAAQNGVVQGIIEDSFGQAIQKAHVTLHQRPPADRPYGASTETDANGRFRFSGVHNGIFQVCAVIPGSDYLSHCVSMNQASQNVVSVGPGAIVTLPPLRLVKGARIRVRVDDVAGVIAAASREPQPIAPSYCCGSRPLTIHRF